MSLAALPVPPGIDEIAARFGAPLVGFAPTPRFEEFTATPALVRGRAVHVSLSYSLLAGPPVPLRPDQEAAIAAAEQSDVPAWIREQLDRLRQPVLWEAVRTALPLPAERNHPLESRLAAHVTDVLRTSFATGQRIGRAPVPSVRPAAIAAELRRGVPFMLDGERLRGVRYDADPRVIAVGARVEDRIVTVVLDRVVTADLSLQFVRRAGSRRDRRRDREQAA